MWLLEETVLRALEAAHESGFEPSAQQAASFAARSSRITTIDGSVARIDIEGVLTPRPDIAALLFGGGNTTYSQIIESVKAASDDSTISSIDLYINSPGGAVDGLFEAIDAIYDVEKPVRAIVVNRATSAAYGLAAQANEIIAYNGAARVGSIGIVVSGVIRDDVVTITSSNAPFKRPDISTATGKAIVRTELDELENLFVQAIAKGRDLRGETIIADFGKGMTFLAAEAMRRGMVDRVGLEETIDDMVKPPTKRQAAVNDGSETKTRAKAMNITELKAEHPALYDQVFALGKKEGVESGMEGERKRVAAHLKLGDKFEAMDIAVKACTDGTEVNDPLAMAEYMTAMADQRDSKDFSADSEENTAGDGDSAAQGGDDDEAASDEEKQDIEAADNILDFAAEKLGLEIKAEA